MTDSDKAEKTLRALRIERDRLQMQAESIRTAASNSRAAAAINEYIDWAGTASLARLYDIVRAA